MDILTTTLLLSFLALNYFHWFSDKIVLKMYAGQEPCEHERIARREAMARRGW